MKSVDIIGYERVVPVSQEVDVVVVGGGIAGACAACASAREGLKTILVERFAFLGGDGTSGGVRGFCGPTLGQGEIFDEIISDLEKFKAVGPIKKSFLGARRYNHEILGIVLQELALRHGVKLFLHARFVDVIVKDGVILHAIIQGKSGLEAIKGKFFIDCSGEADLAVAAGCETMKGRDEDGVQLPMSIMFYVQRESIFKRAPIIPADYFPWEPFKSRADLPMTSFGRLGSSGKSVKVKIPGFDATSTEQLTAAEIQAHRKMMQVIHYYQTKMKKNWKLDYCSPIIGIREGRRVVGEYVLTLEDLRAGREFEDAIAVGAYPLDAHKPDDDKRTYILKREEMKVPPYQIPLRSLVAKGMKNLVVAGRNFSSDQLALSSARVMTTCAMMGQAAGVAAALCIEENVNASGLEQSRVEKIMEKLIGYGAKLDLDFYRNL
ncbi:MAG: FAD-dependent oxidoreductase [Candidatus Hodarchaeota archaeon]